MITVTYRVDDGKQLLRIHCVGHNQFANIFDVRLIRLIQNELQCLVIPDRIQMEQECDRLRVAQFQRMMVRFIEITNFVEFLALRQQSLFQITNLLQ